MAKKPVEKRPFEKAYKIEIQGDNLANFYPTIRTVASELHPANFAFEARLANSMATDSFAWFNVLLINRTIMNKIPIGAFSLQSPGSNRIVLRVPPCSEWGRYGLNPKELAEMAYSGSEYDEHFLGFIKNLENRLRDNGLIVTWYKKLWHESKDFIATIIAKLVAEKTK